jgi:hypothetical protein
MNKGTFPANIVAITFYKPSLEFWNHLKDGVEVTLEREPTNPRDKNAIKVIYNGFHFGYIEKDVAMALSVIMDKGEKTRAVITRVFGTPTDRPHIELKIEV